MTVETLRIRRELWLALRKQLLNDYGDLDNECEAILLTDPRLYIIACIDDEDPEYEELTIKYNPLDIALDLYLDRHYGGKLSSKGRNRRPLAMPTIRRRNRT